MSVPFQAFFGTENGFDGNNHVFLSEHDIQHHHKCEAECETDSAHVGVPAGGILRDELNTKIAKRCISTFVKNREKVYMRRKVYDRMLQSI